MQDDILPLDERDRKRIRKKQVDYALMLGVLILMSLVFASLFDLLLYAAFIGICFFLIGIILVLELHRDLRLGTKIRRRGKFLGTALTGQFTPASTNYIFGYGDGNEDVLNALTAEERKFVRHQLASANIALGDTVYYTQSKSGVILNVEK